MACWNTYSTRLRGHVHVVCLCWLKEFYISMWYLSDCTNLGEHSLQIWEKSKISFQLCWHGQHRPNAVMGPRANVEAISKVKKKSDFFKTFRKWSPRCVEFIRHHKRVQNSFVQHRQTPRTLHAETRILGLKVRIFSSQQSEKSVFDIFESLRESFPRLRSVE